MPAGALLAGALLAGVMSATARAADNAPLVAAPLVAAASDLRFALDEIAQAFARETGTPVRIVYGSSGNFRRQIGDGAPFELFLSADEAFVSALAEEGRTLDAGKLYAIGRIALVVPAGSSLPLDPGLRELAAAAGDGRLRRFAIANPEHAPYGRAAQEALAAAGAWEAMRPRLVYGENVAQAAQFAVSGSAQGGIVALSLALAPGVLGTARFVAIPQSMHRPLRQRMVLTRRAGATARAFYDYLQQEPARAVLARYGLTAPSE